MVAASDSKKLVNDISRATKVDAASVAAVLNHLGLGRILGEAAKAGKVSGKNLKIAFRIGKNTVVM